MKERPILFSAPMVRAILAGTKTQTRRIVKGLNGCHPGILPCPYGAAGDRLWVRETWKTVPWNAGAEKRIEGADHDEEGIRYRATWDRSCAPPWRPSIFMRRNASRITLDVTAVRAERLQDITEDDIRAEGVTRVNVGDLLATVRPRRTFPIAHDWRSLWALGWDAINGKRAPWSSNPWVWVISFTRAES